MAYGTHYTGARLLWPDGSPLNVHRDCLPAISEEQVSEFFSRVRAIIGEATESAAADEGSRTSMHGLAGDLNDVAAAVRVIPNGGPADWNAFNRMGMAVWAATGGDPAGLDLFHAWAERHKSYDADEVAERWPVYPSSPPDKIGAGTLFYLAREAVPTWQRPSAAPTGGVEFDPLTPLLPESAFQRGNQHFALNQDGAALAFVAEYSNSLHYCHQFGCWLKWTGSIWERDHTDLAFEWARKLSRDMADDSVRREFSKVAHASAVERFARSDRDMVVKADDLDRDTFMLGTPDGTVDLRTGDLLPARPDDLIMRSAAVAPAETADCATWLRFLNEATGGDDTLVGFLQRFGGTR